MRLQLDLYLFWLSFFFPNAVHRCSSSVHTLVICIILQQRIHFDTHYTLGLVSTGPSAPLPPSTATQKAWPFQSTKCNTLSAPWAKPQETVTPSLLQRTASYMWRGIDVTALFLCGAQLIWTQGGNLFLIFPVLPYIVLNHRYIFLHRKLRYSQCSKRQCIRRKRTKCPLHQLYTSIL